MEKIKFLDGFALIYFNSNFYSITSLKKSIDEYLEFADFNVKEIGKYFAVKISNKSNLDLKLICFEFSNYVFSKLKNIE